MLLIDAYSPKIAAVRFPESSARPTAKEGPRRRLRIEGVLIEGSNARGLHLYTGALATISKGLRSKAKEYLESDDLRGLDWSKIRDASRREAILVAAAALGDAERQP
jgi:hypothetical protein